MVSQLFVEIIKCELDFPMVAMGEPDPCREPLRRESRYRPSYSCYNSTANTTCTCLGNLCALLSSYAACLYHWPYWKSIYTEEILQAHPRRVIALICMPITTLLDLRDWVVDRALLESTRVISIEEPLIMFLWIIGHRATTREAAGQFQHSTQTISQ